MLKIMHMTLPQIKSRKRRRDVFLDVFAGRGNSFVVAGLFHCAVCIEAASRKRDGRGGATPAYGLASGMECPRDYLFFCAQTARMSFIIRIPVR